MPYKYHNEKKPNANPGLNETDMLGPEPSTASIHENSVTVLPSSSSSLSSSHADDLVQDISKDVEEVRHIRTQLAAEDKKSPDTYLARRTDVLLQIAEKGGALKVKVVEMLIDDGADVNASNRYYGETPLHLAVRNNHIDIIRMLIKKQAAVASPDKLGNIPLHFAAGKKFPDDIIMMLMGSHGKNIVNVANHAGVTPLHNAASAGIIENITALIHADANPNAQDADLNIPLHVAVKHVALGALEILIDHPDAKLSLKNKEGDTPLHRAAVRGNAACVERLLNRGVMPDELNNAGNTPLQLAVLGRGRSIFLQEAKAYPDGPGCIRSLIKFGAHVDVLTEDKNTLLHLAAAHSDVRSIEALLTGGALPNVFNYSNNTSLHIAAERGAWEIVKALLTAGALPNLLNSDKNTPLHLAAAHGSVFCITTLLEHHADANLQNAKGQTPLHMNLAEGGQFIPISLLNSSVDLDAQDYAGQTALHLAMCRRNMVTVSHVVKRGAALDLQDIDADTASLIATRNNYLRALVRYAPTLDKVNQASHTPLSMACAEPTIDPEVIAILMVALVLKHDPALASINLDHSDTQLVIDISHMLGLQHNDKYANLMGPASEAIGKLIKSDLLAQRDQHNEVLKGLNLAQRCYIQAVLSGEALAKDNSGINQNLFSWLNDSNMQGWNALHTVLSARGTPPGYIDSKIWGMKQSPWYHKNEKASLFSSYKKGKDSLEPTFRDKNKHTLN